MKNRAFTLIELLVVVLIIGILAAIAVPKYQYAVVKSKYHSLMSMAQTVKEAQEVYYLANGHYADNFNDLDISMPAGGIESETHNKMTYDDQVFSITLTQSKAAVYKNGNLYMEYNLRLGNVNMWDGARALCVVWTKEGAPKKLCDDLTNAPENCAFSTASSLEGRYTCKIY